ncbi:hypothetical protein [Haloglomus litoreum]|uniref:hypothetical protein n=1 Tax=Haloglomus litoreum TaxID=3034026 RepID=UPI0023E76745|nr:hypothetical protein [Haloglomus sp. DT116]
MNHHELLDVASVRLAALVAGDARYFSRSLEGPSLHGAAAAATVADGVGDLRHAGVETVDVDTPAGTFAAAYLPWQWHGPDHPTLVYLHGSGERPFDFGRFGSNSFRRLFVGADVPANLIAVRAPFHEGSNREYLREMGDLENFVGMLAASTGLVDALVDRASEVTEGPVVVSGISLGGWTVNLHRACHGSADRYAPLLAGAAPGELFVSSAYRHLTATAALERAAHLRDRLDFEAAFTAVEAADCDPLLGRYDRIVEFDRQRDGYAGLPLAVLETGHVTGALATERLREHVLGALAAAEREE